MFASSQGLGMILCGLLLLQVGCSATTASSGSSASDTASDSDTETTVTADTADRVTTVAGALIPAIGSSTSTSFSPLTRAVSYGDSDDFSTYTSDSNIAYLQDIFGANLSGPVTQVRVLLSQFSNTLDNVLTLDASAACNVSASAVTSAGFDTLAALTDSDSVTLPFYGAVLNGSTGDRRFDCVLTSGAETIVYGQDSTGTISIAHMSLADNTNTESADTRGDTQRLAQIVYATYAEATEDSGTAAYLDLQYAQATLYNGVDGTFGNDDDVSFKSRSRITGRVELTSAGAAAAAQGDFTVTKFDQSPTPEGDPSTTVTRTYGRGGFGNTESALFTIDSTVDAFASIPGTFCIQQSGTTLARVESTDCTTLETAFAWGSATFPFTISPSIGADYEDKTFFAGDSTDLIASDLSNFTIPTY